MNKNVARTCTIKEPSISVSLKRLSPILDPNFGLVSEIIRERQYYDEPKFWHFTARVSDQFIKQNTVSFKTGGSGCSFFSKKEALLKCLAEVIERFSNNYFSEAFVAKTAKLRDITDGVIPIDSFTRYSKSQLQNKVYSKFVFKPESELRWTTCESLTSDKTYLVPCNFIYLSCPHAKEPVIYPAISTGVAAGWTLASAILRGLYESIERDAYMIAYLKKIQYPKIRLDGIKDEKIQFFLETARKYHLEIHCLDFTTNINIPVICAAIIDRTGIGKAVSLGLKSNANKNGAVIGAITEAFHTKGWIRKMHEMDDASYEKEIKNANNPRMILRGLFWYDVARIKKLDFWLQNDKYIDINENSVFQTVKDELDLVINKLHAQHMDMYWKDITVDELRHLGLQVVKTIVPQLQPLTFDDERQPQGGRRLNDVPEWSGYTYNRSVNRYPHPFL